MNTISKQLIYLAILAISFVLLSSNSCNNKTLDCNKKCTSTGPVIIYKTKKDYSDQVCIKLSEDKSTITAYPGPKDVINQKPIQLADGYLLKKMPGNAFLSITIDDYAKGNYDKNKSLKDFVVDDNPFTEIYECCKCVTRNVDSINLLIEYKQLKYCSEVK